MQNPWINGLIQFIRFWKKQCKLYILMYFVKTPFLLKWIFPQYVWKVQRTKKKVFLTFDDGPIPLVTDFILDVLKKQQVKATFFCVGENVAKQQAIYNRILQEGHQVGNHTFNHLNGWKTATKKYVQNVVKAQNRIKSKLFRPPYGKITPKQAKLLQKSGFKIIMWSILSGDFDQEITAEICYKNVIKNVRNGDIIVFHDNIKSKAKLELILEKTIIALKQKEFEFGLL